MYAILLTKAGGAIYHGTHRINVATGSSHENEGLGSSKAAERVLQAQELERAFGNGEQRPTLLGTDSSSSLSVAVQQAAAARARHCLRRWTRLRRLLKEGAINMVHVPDTCMPADFMTKFLDKKKVEASIKYATNSDNAVPIPAEEEAQSKYSES